MRFIFFFLILIYAFSSYSAETLFLNPSKTSVLILKEEAGQIVIGDPVIADVSLDSKRSLILFGKKIGETSLTVFGRTGEILLEKNIRVAENSQGKITLIAPSYKEGSVNQSQFLCTPKCSLLSD